jgi:hypothetical protein
MIDAMISSSDGVAAAASIGKFPRAAQQVAFDTAARSGLAEEP